MNTRSKAEILEEALTDAVIATSKELVARTGLPMWAVSKELASMRARLARGRIGSVTYWSMRDRKSDLDAAIGEARSELAAAGAERRRVEELSRPPAEPEIEDDDPFYDRPMHGWRSVGDKWPPHDCRLGPVSIFDVAARALNDSHARMAA